MISGPKHLQAFVGRELECQGAMREEFELLTELAERSGWRWDEIALALLELTSDYACAQGAAVIVSPQPRRGCELKTRH
ncbi:hypothetical protein [Ensifer sp. MJa1]|jgi:hypothetical protein|uniref:hypothetical protein n=1 Tax=Ensifer sp. MJa1 TaxID=2919888 RepID=UPI00300B67A1